MIKKIFALIFVLSFINLLAQKFQPQIQSSEVINKTSEAFEDNLSILAVMVEFQPDDFDLTYGDGTFGSIYSQVYGNDIIDPLPHNKNYFEDHLQFAVNYYNKVSNGNVNIDFTVLPNIYKVSKLMREYSPVGDESFKVLADFSKEVWEIVSQANPSFNFSEFNTFIIFHAGVGKDISTSDLLGEARDLPSIYLGEKSLKNFYGESFAGFPLSDGSLISNTIILPETESREESGFGEVALLELSINGLLVSSIASHLSLPDLFDAETGKSAIGRFGLMDGQSLFAYAGLFPPQPSAWEKIYLGWETPTLVNSNSININVVARQIAQENQNTIIKIPINSSEYYLIENRARDANNDGVTITYKVAGQVRTINFTEDLENFNNAFVDTLKGVVLDVDEFDWAVPGNGILIWHIDEKIANEENIAANRVNIGENRGVDLEEADGIQDIGEEFQTIFGDIIIAEGEEFDFWYSSNPSRLYQNKFGMDTKPNTMTNNGANSLITFSNFSDIANEMSFDVSFDTENVSLLYTRNKNGNLVDFNLIDGSKFIKAYVLVDNDLVRVVGHGRFEIEDFASSEFILFEKDSIQFFFGTINNSLNIATNENQLIASSVNFEGENTAPIVVQENSDIEISIYLGMSNGEVQKYNYNLQTKAQPILDETISFFNDPITQVAILDNEIVAASGSKIKFSNSVELDIESSVLQIILTKNKSGNYSAISLSENNLIGSFDKGMSIGKILAGSDSEISSISLADIKKDGENYIVFNEGNIIKAVNFDGSIADNFPYQNKMRKNFEGAPLIADLNSDGFDDIISLTDNGNVYAVSGDDGKLIPGFPLSVGGITPSLSTIVKREDDLLLSVTSSNNDIFFWSINSTGDVKWGSKYGDNYNSSSVGSAENKNIISTFFPKNKTYNWPNPVYGDITYIRTYVSEDSRVKVKVFDLAGDLVEEFGFMATGGLEAECGWNVSKIQSGAYFAHVEVNSSSGKTESKIIKIAVVK